MIFGVHGALWGNAMTWWDHDTGSIWSQPLGEAIAGPRKGQTVELLPMSYTTWGAWQQAHPNTVALDAPAARTGFNLDTFYLVVDFDTEAKAYPVPDLRQVGVVNDQVAGADIAVVIDPADQQRWTVFSRQLGAQSGDDTVTLSLEGDALVDTESGSIWDPVTGVALSGPRQGQVLDRLPAFTSLPDDYDTFWPEGTLWTP